jgi:tRNA U34 5-methylaminomethyl-2-thiouridine-forming methyltransferase MnmC
MNQDLSWQEKNYSIVITDDGSPSLHGYRNSEGPDSLGELMHHRGGALSETEQIYGKVISKALSMGMTSLISVGLGLGYNELMIAREIFRGGFSDRARDFRVLSFESDPFLSEKLIQFILGDDLTSPLHSQVLTQMAPGHELEVKAVLRALWKTEKWQVKGALERESFPKDPYEVVLYDAFSSKTNPELWSEEFLDLFLRKALASRGFFSTYACTGALKRSLKANGFQVELREGFHGKRNSTLGFRELI